MRHRDEIKSLIDNGQYAEAFRNEMLDIQKNAYDKGEEGKYDGAAKQALDAEIGFIKEYGVPKTK
jgi:phosphoglycerol transferase MdoB-like AlkP superfamily enzyme